MGAIKIDLRLGSVLDELLIDRQICADSILRHPEEMGSTE